MSIQTLQTEELNQVSGGLRLLVEDNPVAVIEVSKFSPFTVLAFAGRVLSEGPAALKLPGLPGLPKLV